MKFSAGQAIFKYIPASATKTTTATNYSFTFLLKFNNDVNNIITGMIVSSPTNGIITGLPVVTNIVGANIIVNNPQIIPAIPANSTLYSNLTCPKSYLKAMQIRYIN
jgi:hypothetical protein